MNAIDQNNLTTSPPKINDDIFIWADFFELCCLSENTLLSNEDLYQKIFKGQDFIAEKENAIRPAQADKVKAKIKDGLSNVALRSNMLGSKYPFLYDSDRMEISPYTELTNIQKTYIVLLLASNLKYIRIKERSNLTSSFEKICFETMKVIFPMAHVRLFGSSNAGHVENNDKYLSAKLKERIKALALDICQKPTSDVENLPDSNLGDGGLDIVGFIKMKDNRGSYPLFFVQCACSKDEWADKQQSTMRHKWERWIDIRTTSLQNFIMVPFPFIDNNKEWVRAHDITQNILIDRIRIINFLEEDICEQLVSFNLIKEKAEI